MPGSLAVPRQPACGLNGASILQQRSLQDTVAALLPAPAGQDASAELAWLRTTLTKTLVMSIMFMQVGGLAALH